MPFDYVFVGAGLQSALCLLALASRRPGARVALVEQAESALGNHTWCYHALDVPSPARGWVEPAVARRWPRYRVAFPSYERVLDQPYSLVTIASLGRALDAALERLDAHCLFGRRAQALDAHSVLLDDGSQIWGTLVIDARGPEHGAGTAVGYQKFVGHELRLRAPYAGDPTVMDATVAQLDGFRFVYCLPLADERVLLEDTYYSCSATLDVPAISARILQRADELGLSVAAIERTEQGVLPLPGRAPLAADARDAPLRAGYRGGWFHPVTGYSFPLAVRFALHLAELPPEAARGPQLDTLLRDYRRQAGFLALLNRLLFGALPDGARRNVLERFYRLPAPLIERFYAQQLTTWDRTRIVCGRPPAGLSLLHALRHPLPRSS